MFHSKRRKMNQYSSNCIVINHSAQRWNFMFDKNSFKNKFRKWSEDHPFAPLEEAGKFCEDNIPPESLRLYGWLKEESVAWFEWRQQTQRQEFFQESLAVTIKN